MKKLLKIGFVLFILLIIGVFITLSSLVVNQDPDMTYELRGRYKASLDGKTYLVIEDNNGGGCGPLYVNKKIWSHKLNKKGEVISGTNSIECGTKMSIIIKEGTTYYFDYWGP